MRASVAMRLMRWPPAPSTIGFWLSRSTRIAAWMRRSFGESSKRSISTVLAYGNSSPSWRNSFSRISSAARKRSLRSVSASAAYCAGPLRQARGAQLEQQLDLAAGARADRHHLGEVAAASCPIDQRHQPALVGDGIGLVDRQQHRPVGGQQARDLLVGRRPGAAVAHHHHHVGVFGRRLRGAVQHLVQQRFARSRLVTGDCRAEQQLRVGPSDDTDDAVARGLRPIGGDRQLLSDQPVQQRRLADIGTADDRDMPAAEHRRPGTQAALAGRDSSSPCRGGAPSTARPRARLQRRRRFRRRSPRVVSRAAVAGAVPPWRATARLAGSLAVRGVERQFRAAACSAARRLPPLPLTEHLDLQFRDRALDLEDLAVRRAVRRDDRHRPAAESAALAGTPAAGSSRPCRASSDRPSSAPARRARSITAAPRRSRHRGTPRRRSPRRCRPGSRAVSTRRCGVRLRRAPGTGSGRALGEFVQRLLLDQVGAQPRQVALVDAPEVTVQHRGDDAVEHRIAEELEPLVVRLAVAAMRQRLPQQRGSRRTDTRVAPAGRRASGASRLSWGLESPLIVDHQAGRTEQRNALLVGERHDRPVVPVLLDDQILRR